ncbi:MAG TPA: hypothetical protein VHZ95_14670 [Polyangiales bacterium]|nr:hypothetical protein [Polyangiales bacterium]
MAPLRNGSAEGGLGSTTLVDKALSLSRFDEAERLLSSRLSALLARAGSAANDTDRDAFRVATGYALKLAEGLQKPSWLDYPFDLYMGALILMPSDTIEALYRIIARMRYANPHAVHRYVAGLRASDAKWDASERFLLQRLESLERRIASG